VGEMLPDCVSVADPEGLKVMETEIDGKLDEEGENLCVADVSIDSCGDGETLLLNVGVSDEV